MERGRPNRRAARVDWQVDYQYLSIASVVSRKNVIKVSGSQESPGHSDPAGRERNLLLVRFKSSSLDFDRDDPRFDGSLPEQK